MATSHVKLLGLESSPYVNRVQFALKIKSIPYEFILENLSNKSELLLKSNSIHKKVPVLFHDDKPICESRVILDYIDEVWSHGPSILPSNPYDRAIAHFWALYIDDQWYALFIESRDTEDEEKKTAILEKILERTLVLEDAFVKISKGKPFFGGETIGYLDIVLGCFLGWLRVYEIIRKVKILDESQTPALVKWAERFSSEKVTQGISLDPQELIKLLLVARAAKTAASR